MKPLVSFGSNCFLIFPHCASFGFSPKVLIFITVCCVFFSWIWPIVWVLMFFYMRICSGLEVFHVFDMKDRHFFNACSGVHCVIYLFIAVFCGIVLSFSWWCVGLLKNVECIINKVFFFIFTLCFVVKRCVLYSLCVVMVQWNEWGFTEQVVVNYVFYVCCFLYSKHLWGQSKLEFKVMLYSHALC